MGKYDWFIIINLLAWGYLLALLVNCGRNIILHARKNHWDISLFFSDVLSSFRATCGIGSLSILLFALAFVWLSKCDEILQLFNIPSWSNGSMGNHVGSCYSLFFFIPAFIIGYKFRKDFAADFVMKLSGVFSFLFISCTVIFIFYR